MQLTEPQKVQLTTEDNQSHPDQIQFNPFYPL